MRAWLLTVLILVILSGALVGLYFGVPSFKEFVQENIFASDSPAEESGPDMPYEPEAQKTPKSDPSTPSPSLVPRPTSIPPSRPAPKITSRQETAIVKKYPYIKFPTLEKAVNNWFGIPSKLFPIQVIIVNGTLISTPLAIPILSV